MRRVCFICLGNICRSPMAEFMMKYYTQNKDVIIASRGTSYEEDGNDMYPPAKDILTKYHIPFTRHKATRLEVEDYDKFDEFYCMEERNLDRAISILGGDSKHKVKLLLDRDISDPWYTGDFQKTYEDLYEGIQKII